MKDLILYLSNFYPNYTIFKHSGNCISITSDVFLLDHSILIMHLKNHFKEATFKITIGFNVSFKTHVFIYQPGLDCQNENKWLKPFVSGRKPSVRTTQRMPKSK